MSYDVYSHDGIMTSDDIKLEVDRTLGTCPTSTLCAMCTQLDLVHWCLGTLQTALYRCCELNQFSEVDIDILKLF